MNRIFFMCNHEMRCNLKRPLFWILILTLVFITYGLTSGMVRIESGDTGTGGIKSWLTSEFSTAFFLMIIGTLIYTFFISVIAGMTVLRDDELKIQELIQSTRLTPKEYIWGKYLATMVSFTLILFMHSMLSVLFNHILPTVSNPDIIGPFHLNNYIKPAIFFMLPFFLFISGITLLLGTWSRKASLVFLLPVLLLCFQIFFLWEWSPTDLNIQLNQLLMIIDPSGFRWLNETWLSIDKGVEFYNTHSIPFDPIIIINRLLLIIIGLSATILAGKKFTARIRGRNHGSLGTIQSIVSDNPNDDIDSRTHPPMSPPAPITISRNNPSWLNLFRVIFFTEIQEFRGQAGLYLFVPLIIVITILDSLTSIGIFDVPLLITPGTFAIQTMKQLTVMVILLLMFYIVESLQRERSQGIASILYSTPISNAVLLAGKIAANSAIALLIIAALFIAGIITLLIQQTIQISLMPFILIWIVLLLPTFVAWSSFVAAAYVVLNNRFTTYAVCLAALIFTGFRQTVGKMNWVGNWNIWDAVRWSDIAVIELDRHAIILNRLFVLSLTIFFTSIAIRFYHRRDSDAVKTIARFKIQSMAKKILPILTALILPLFLGSWLFHDVRTGYQGKLAEKKEKDYWRHNLATYKHFSIPDITHVNIDLELYPDKGQLKTQGSYQLINNGEDVLDRIPLTANHTWQNLSWTMNGRDYDPENRSHLMIFRPENGLNPMETLTIGYSFDAKVPNGISKNGGGISEFILPSGIVLTSFTTSFTPLLGYVEDIGIDNENRYDAKDYPPDFYIGKTDALFGTNAAFTTEIHVTVPADFIANSVGVLTETTEDNGRITYHWTSDYPVRFFNIVAGKWAKKSDDGVAVYYHPGHEYNIDEILLGLKSARKYYSEWYGDFPWQNLRISEFPGLAYYAQGFPTNISFSENIGFLTRDTDEKNAAFTITAHEASHQWWGNVLTPGDGPGGNVMAEGMAHFSAMLLLEQVKGKEARRVFCRKVEDQYINERMVNNERPLVQVDGTRPGDGTLMYNKGSWVFWMLTQYMGREAMFTGLREFIELYRYGPDYPMLQDMLEVLRRHARDPIRFDTFIDQWFFRVVLPEYRLDNINLSAIENGNWQVNGKIKNLGSGKMPVNIAFYSHSEDEWSDYGSQREMMTLMIDAEEEKTISMLTPFKPVSIVIDPDLMVLQMDRKNATVHF